MEKEEEGDMGKYFQMQDCRLQTGRPRLFDRSGRRKRKKLQQPYIYIIKLSQYFEIKERKRTS